jgi:hypothetical protein
MTSPCEHLELSARRVYDAECALHIARMSAVDSWIAAASDRLHLALIDFIAASANHTCSQRKPAPPMFSAAA